MRAVLFLALLLGSASCGTAPDAACRKTQGNIWECDSAGNNCRCAEPTTDGGKQCFDKSQCQGRCIQASGSCDGDPSDPPVGACESTDSKFGCHELVTTVEDPTTGTSSAVCESSCP